MKFSFIHAKSASDIVDPSTTLGIEITVDEVAARCSIDNLDGQHGAPSKYFGLAAIEIACDCEVPAAGTTFATSRPDLDSIGAMAVLVLRSIGLEQHIDRDLVAAIAAADSFRSGAWTPCPLPTKENPWPRGPSTVDSTRETADLGMICSPRRGDFAEMWSLADRVFVIAWALVVESTVDWHINERHKVFVLVAAAFPSATVDVDHWLAAAHTRVYDARLALAREAHTPGALTDRGTVVEVRVAHAGALSLGYCLRPVVLAFDQAVSRKVTICGYTDGHLDSVGLTAELNSLELDALGFCEIHFVRVFADGRREHTLPRVQVVDTAIKTQKAMSAVGAAADPPYTVEFVTEYEGAVFEPGLPPKWGGPRNMCSSPQNVGTCLDDESIRRTVARFVID